MTTTPSTTSCSPGDVFLINVRFTDDSGIKKRPAVIVSNQAYHTDCADAVIVPLTSNTMSRLRLGDHALQDWSQAGLLKASIAKATPQTIERSTMGAQLGALTTRDLSSVVRRLRSILA